MPERYTLIGEGPIKVLAGHTWFADHSTYRPMFPYLNTAAHSYAFLDFRGYGDSKTVEGAFSIPEMGQDMVDCADRLGWREFHLLGNSMGGQAAQWVAATYPNRVKSLALLSSVPAQGSPLDADTMAFFKKAVTDLLVREQIAATVTGGRYSQHFAAWMTELSAGTASKQAIEAYLHAWTSNPGGVDAIQYAGPVKAFVGEFDPVLTKEATENTIGKTFRNCEIEVISNCGHFAPVEVPVYTATAVEAFFAKHAA